MQTIKERAEQNYPLEEDIMSRVAYRVGAEEQKAIDIEKACEMAWQCLLPSTPKDVADARMEKFRKALEQA